MSGLTLTLAQPAQLGDRARKDFVLSTFERIPGSVVRGAFAAAWLAAHGASTPGTKERAEFLGLFEGGARFGSLLRDGTEHLSLAVIGHKHEPVSACEIVDYDCAMTGDEPPLYCPDCGSPLERRRGLDGNRPAPARRTSVAISEEGVAREGQLFTRETLGAGQPFRGTLIASAEQLAILAGLGPVRVGGRRTTHGLAQVAISDAGTPPGPQRRPQDDLLVVRLRSQAIFTDDFGRPVPEPSPAELQAVLGVPARVRKRWTRWEQAGGWHAASGLPKPQELAVAAGSTFLIEPERTVADAGLARLAEQGIGLRRHEGFGDLAPAPALRPGRAQRAAEAGRRQRLADRAAPIRRVQLRVSADAWRKVLDLMAAHATGDAQATARLRGNFANYPDNDVRAAMTVFLDLPPADAAHVAEVLSR